MKIGILGGGQLSRMLVMEGMHLGVEFCFYLDKPTECINEFHDIIVAPYQDEAALRKFAQHCDVITYESENIPYETVLFLESLKAVYPQAEAIRISQDRLLEKALFTHLGIPVAPFKPVENKQDIIDFSKTNGFGFFVKKRRLGYDGKGQRFITTMIDIENLEMDFCKDAICESKINFIREVSMIAITAKNGERCYYDICENEHQAGILRQTFNRIHDPIHEKAKNYIDRIITELNYVGCLVFEFFQVGDELIGNEIAPRVHNSGHWTIEAAVTSQFENHVRAITGYALGKTTSLGACKMINLLGSIPDKLALLNKANYHLHDYKKFAALGRKVGHVTIFPLDESL